jgi:GTP cyclohydrolase II
MMDEDFELQEKALRCLLYGCVHASVTSYDNVNVHVHREVTSQDILQSDAARFTGHEL